MTSSQILAIKGNSQFLSYPLELGENDYLMSQLFSPSFMRIGQK